jgi:hypothetical protein
VRTITFPTTPRANDRGFIRRWLALPPIGLDESAGRHEEATQKPVFDREWFPGQSGATPAEGDTVTIDGKEFAWKAAHCGVPWKFKAVDNSLYLGITYLVCRRPIPNVRLSIGSDDSSMWRLNGREVIRQYVGRGVKADQSTSRPLSLRRGVNVLTFAVINGRGGAGACARFLDSASRPVTRFKVTVEPPGRN